MADESARTSATERTLTLAYTLSPERLILHFQGAHHWLSRVSVLVDDATSSLRLAGFDEIKFDNEGRAITLQKNLPQDQ